MCILLNICRNVLDPFVWHMGWSLVSVKGDLQMHWQKHANCVVENPVMILLASEWLKHSIWSIFQDLSWFCRSSFEWNSAPFDVPDLYAKPGTPCDNYNGYCDVFQKCREVDPSGPLATLRRLLLSNESMESIRRWLNEQWIYMALLCLLISILVVLVLFF